MKMKRFMKIAGVATALTLMMAGTVFAAGKNGNSGNKGRKEYRAAVLEMEQTFEAAENENDGLQKENEAYALWYMEMSENFRTAELSLETAEKWEKAQALREEIRKIQNDEEAVTDETGAAVTEKKQAGAKAARMALEAADGEKIKKNTEVKELRAEMKALADNGEFEEALSVYEKVLSLRNERAAEKIAVNKIWKEMAELFEAVEITVE